MTKEEVAKILLEINAVTLNTDEPYRYTSGILSPIYCDNRLIMSYPDKRTQIVEAFLGAIEDNKLDFDMVGGTATAGIPHAAWIADRLESPMVYIRGKVKGHGKKNQVEGALEKGKQVLIIEDLISTGGSSVEAGEAVRNEGGEVSDCVAIFTYEMEKAKKRFADSNINLYTLTDFTTLVGVASESGYLKEEDKDKVLAWNKDPEGWGKTMGYE
ncbi:orotate phosphoribosyltransferase [Patescibacteria group bacterium]